MASRATVRERKACILDKTVGPADGRFGSGAPFGCTSDRARQSAVSPPARRRCVGRDGDDARRASRLRRVRARARARSAHASCTRPATRRATSRSATRRAATALGSSCSSAARRCRTRSSTSRKRGPRRRDGAVRRRLSRRARAWPRRLLFAAGSGITPIRALLQYLLDRRQGHGRVALYYGQRSDSRLRVPRRARRLARRRRAPRLVRLAAVAVVDRRARLRAAGRARAAPARDSTQNAVAFLRDEVDD